MKAIFKPDAWKFSLTLSFLFITSLLWHAFVSARLSDTFLVGFPFQFFIAWGPCLPGQTCSESHGLYLLLDIGIWYIVSAFILSRLQKR